MTLPAIPTLPPGLPPISQARLPQVYEQAKTAIATCDRIDECKDWADKFEALASYAKQAGDDGLRKMSDRIQARAIRRCGELLRQIEDKHRGRPLKNSMGTHTNLTRKAAAKNAGLSKHQKDKALQVSNVPEEEFKSAIESEDPPTVTALAERGKKPSIALSKKRVWVAQETKHFTKEILRLVRSYEKTHAAIKALAIIRSNGLPTSIEVIGIDSDEEVT